MSILKRFIISFVISTLAVLSLHCTYPDQTSGQSWTGLLIVLVAYLIGFIEGLFTKTS